MTDDNKNLDRLYTRYAVLENDVAGLKSAVGDLTGAVKEMRDAVVKLPQQQGYGDVIKTIAATTAVIVTLMTIANGWFDGRVATDRQKIDQIFSEARELSVLKYRLQQIEVKLAERP